MKVPQIEVCRGSYDNVGRLMLECGDTENETVPCHHLIHYRMDTSPCSCTAGYDSNFEGGGTELEIFVKCV
jgi:hypothetical protein